MQQCYVFSLLGLKGYTVFNLAAARYSPLLKTKTEEGLQDLHA
jgi:hypothetical protein